MKYTTVKNLIWNKDQSAIDCLVNFSNIGEVPFSASPNDFVSYGQEIYARCVAGDFGPIAEYVPHIDEGDNPKSTAPLSELQIPVTNTGKIL